MFNLIVYLLVIVPAQDLAGPSPRHYAAGISQHSTAELCETAKWQAASRLVVPGWSVGELECQAGQAQAQSSEWHRVDVLEMPAGGRDWPSHADVLGSVGVPGVYDYQARRLVIGGRNVRVVAQ